MRRARPAPGGERAGGSAPARPPREGWGGGVEGGRAGRPGGGAHGTVCEGASGRGEGDTGAEKGGSGGSALLRARRAGTDGAEPGDAAAGAADPGHPSLSSSPLPRSLFLSFPRCPPGPIATGGAIPGRFRGARAGSGRGGAPAPPLRRRD